MGELGWTPDEVVMNDWLRVALDIYYRSVGTGDEWIAYALLRAVVAGRWGSAQ